MATYYWVDDDADHSSLVANNWASSSGGEGGAGVPGSGDDVIFDSSGNTDCNVGYPTINADTIEVQSGYTSTIGMYSSGDLCGELTLASGATLDLRNRGANIDVINQTSGTITGSTGILTMPRTSAAASTVAAIKGGTFIMPTLWIRPETTGLSFEISGTNILTGKFKVSSSGQVIDITNTGNLEIRGDITIESALNSYTKGTGTITLSGTAAQSVDFNDETIEDLDIDKSAETVTLTDGFTTDSFTLSDGTLDVNGNGFISTGNFTQAAATTVTDTA